MFSSEDEKLLAQPLPEPRAVRVRSPVFADGSGVIEYREAGAPERPAVLLLHGIGSSSAGYRAQLAGLQSRWRVIAWNAPGFGGSTPLADPQPECSRYVDAAVAMLEVLGIRQLAGLVGSSWGSVVAAAFAHSAGIPLKALVLSAPNTARGYDRPAEEREAARQEALRVGLESFTQDRERIADKLLSPDVAASARAHTLRLRDAVTPAGWQQAMNMLFTVHTPKLLPGIAAELTVIVGRDDTLAPEESHAAVLRAARSDMTYHRLEGVGHMPKLEAPVAFNDLVRRSIIA